MTKSVPRPTDAELELLRVLWRDGPGTVRQVRDAVGRRPLPGYTTVLKVLQIMTGKGLVVRDERQRTHVYRARVSEESTQRRLIGDLAERAFGGARTKLVLRALADTPASAAELAEIRRLLDQLERGSQVEKGGQVEKAEIEKSGKIEKRGRP